MNTKIIFTIATMALLTGCAAVSDPNRVKMDAEDLNHFQVDCSRKEEQLAFLRSQMPTHHEQRVNNFTLSGVVGYTMSALNGTLADGLAMRDGQTSNAVRTAIWQIEDLCRGPEMEKYRQPQGCVQIDESMPSGASNGAKCVQNGAKPTTRWEALIDSK